MNAKIELLMPSRKIFMLESNYLVTGYCFGESLINSLDKVEFFYLRHENIDDIFLPNYNKNQQFSLGAVSDRNNIYWVL